ncbi:MAG TPA: HD domain-containing phosphohydrolase [Candidatus Dormibacteraeota bacterium]|jgi:putative two-component system response regulator
MSKSGRQTVLVIDNDPLARELARESLGELGCDVVEAGDGIDGLQAARRYEPDLVLLDIRMPGLDGWAVCRRLKELPRGRLTPIVMVSGAADAARALEAGADGILPKPYLVQELADCVRSLLKTSAFYGTLDEIDNFLVALARVLDAKSESTHQHSSRVADMCRALGVAAGLDGRALADLRRAALIHDVGKVGIPDAILSKPGRLDDAELSQMRAHITIGAELIAPLAKAADLAPVIRHHHERWDGQGYPDGLAGEQIPLEARIVSICDSWDAMVNDRPYRRALTVDSASAELAAGAGSQWDPALVKLFVGLNQPLLATAS